MQIQYANVGKFFQTLNFNPGGSISWTNPANQKLEPFVPSEQAFSDLMQIIRGTQHALQGVANTDGYTGVPFIRTQLPNAHPAIRIDDTGIYLGTAAFGTQILGFQPLNNDNGASLRIGEVELEDFGFKTLLPIDGPMLYMGVKTYFLKDRVPHGAMFMCAKHPSGLSVRQTTFVPNHANVLNRLEIEIPREQIGQFQELLIQISRTQINVLKIEQPFGNFLFSWQLDGERVDENEIKLLEALFFSVYSAIDANAVGTSR